MAGKSKKKKAKKQRKKLLILILTSAVFVIVVIVAVIINSSSTTVVCDKGETLNSKTNKCIAKPKVVNGKEQVDSILGFVLKDGDDIVFRISSGTMESMGISSSANYENVDTGDRYIYLDPETNTFETKTNQEIEELKNNGKVCLSSEDAWLNIGKDTCVAFRPTYWYNTGNIIFLNEYKEYRNGFVVPIMTDFASWDDLRAQYEGKAVAVSGVIERYEGHPEIKVYASRALKIATPIGWSSSKGMIYTMDK